MLNVSRRNVQRATAVQDSTSRSIEKKAAKERQVSGRGRSVPSGFARELLAGERGMHDKETEIPQSTGAESPCTEARRTHAL
jgi:hypothetical protein